MQWLHYSLCGPRSKIVLKIAIGIELLIWNIFFYVVVSNKCFSGRIRWNVYKRKLNLNFIQLLYINQTIYYTEDLDVFYTPNIIYQKPFKNKWIKVTNLNNMFFVEKLVSKCYDSIRNRFFLFLFQFRRDNFLRQNNKKQIK